ncbi:MAG: MBOAT family protein [Ruminococcaceae bacterium]|nr:MBOAT family protein [Oscillospiraceae bacterium]
MAVISLSFLTFCAVTITGYFIVPMKIRLYWLLAANLFFYGCFGLEAFLPIGITILSTYVCARIVGGLIDKGRVGSAKAVLIFTLVLNLGILGIVKYLNYSLSLLGRFLVFEISEVSLIVPLGIAFYSMQAAGYCIDVYRKKYAPERNFWKYTLYMTFFPIIMQGPISRYDQLSPSLFTQHRFSFERMKSGLSLVLWGLFKKMVIADRAAIIANQVFGHYAEYSGAEIIVAALMYTVQIYTDFSGCVDISRGIAEVLGISLVDNFDHPYFSTSIKDFWRRWHRSLSSWFRDYLYIPLGGSRKGNVRKYINLLIVFFFSGLWHGVGVHYIAWGILQGVYQIVGERTQKARYRLYDACGINRESRVFRFGQSLVTFGLVTVSWVFFRADGLITALKMLKSAVFGYPWLLTNGALLKLGLDGMDWNVLVLSLGVLLAVSLLQERMSVRQALERHSFWIRYPVYIAAVMTILIFGIYGPGYDAAQFLYMQF